MTLEEQVRAEHPEWTDQQVMAEVARIEAEQQPPAQPPVSGSGEADAAFAAMRRRAEAAERERDEAKGREQEREREEAEKRGEWERIAAEEKSRREELEARQREAENERNAERTAGDLKFKDAGYALYLLRQQKVDLADAPAVRSALDQVARDRTDLIGSGAPLPSGGPAGGSSTERPKVTREDIKKMTAAQVSALDPQVLSEALAA